MEKLNLSLYKPLALNEIGKRGNNEDSIYPLKGEATEDNRLFMVCDGVGGTNKGEVASALICEYLPQFCREHLSDGHEISHDLTLEAVQHVEEKFRDYLIDHPECKGMASTLSMVMFKPNACVVAWAGDSRIYQLRNGQIVFKSKDHSVVSELVESGEITEQEARVHPLKNRITRAINGEEPVELEVQTLTDFQAGDIFLLCSDGILESVDDHDLVLLTKDPLTTIEHVLEEIHLQAHKHSRDNFSLYLIKVATVADEVPDDEGLTYPIEVNIPEPESDRGLVDWFLGLFKRKWLRWRFSIIKSKDK